MCADKIAYWPVAATQVDTGEGAMEPLAQKLGVTTLPAFRFYKVPPAAACLRALHDVLCNTAVCPQACLTAQLQAVGAGALRLFALPSAGRRSQEGLGSAHGACCQEGSNRLERSCSNTDA
jgi:hypothetical protein